MIGTKNYLLSNFPSPLNPHFSLFFKGKLGLRETKLSVCVTRSNSWTISHISWNSVRTTYHWWPLQFRLHNLSLSIRCQLQLSIYCLRAVQRCFIDRQFHRGLKELPCIDAPPLFRQAEAHWKASDQRPKSLGKQQQRITTDVYSYIIHTRLR